jgi:hypothetical protein
MTCSRTESLYMRCLCCSAATGCNPSPIFEQSDAGLLLLFMRCSNVGLRCMETAVTALHGNSSCSEVVIMSSKSEAADAFISFLFRLNAASALAHRVMHDLEDTAPKHNTTCRPIASSTASPAGSNTFCKKKRQEA